MHTQIWSANGISINKIHFVNGTENNVQPSSLNVNKKRTAFFAKSPEATKKKKKDSIIWTQKHNTKKPDRRMESESKYFGCNQKHIKLNCVTFIHRTSYDIMTALLLQPPGSNVGFTYKKENGTRWP
jgi:hypothetical protein